MSTNPKMHGEIVTLIILLGNASSHLAYRNRTFNSRHARDYFASCQTANHWNTTPVRKLIIIIIIINIYIAQIPCEYVQMRVTNKYGTN